MFRTLMLATLAALPLTPAFAQDAAALEEAATIAALIDEARALCDGDFTIDPDAAQQKDLNGDGTLDWILDESGYSCSTSTQLYCGTGGCTLNTLIDGTQGGLLVQAWDLIADGGTIYIAAPNKQGDTVRFLWSGTEWVLQ